MCVSSDNNLDFNRPDGTRDPAKAGCSFHRILIIVKVNLKYFVSNH